MSIEINNNNNNNINNDTIDDNNINSKKIVINCFNNKYKQPQMNNNKELKKRVESEKWNFSIEYFNNDKQLLLLKHIYGNTTKSENPEDNKVLQIIIQQINKKIYGYKQQDTIKKMYDEPNFVNIQNIIDKLIENDLTCYYCKKELLVLYDISREMKQWSVDRINNYKGHNIDNYRIACLECNLKKRRRSDDKFLFTKPLNLVKMN